MVIGTVVEELRGHEGTFATFRLRVDEVLRGDPPATLDILGLRSGLPLEGSQSCRENAFLYARVGDVLALALDGRLDGRDGVNTAAWIEGRPASPIEGKGKLTRAAVRRAAGSAPAGDVPTPLTLLDRPRILVNRLSRNSRSTMLGHHHRPPHSASSILERHDHRHRQPHRARYCEAHRPQPAAAGTRRPVRRGLMPPCGGVPCDPIKVAEARQALADRRREGIGDDPAHRAPAEAGGY